MSKIILHPTSHHNKLHLQGASTVIVDALVPGTVCPGCGKRGAKRRGVHFDNEYRCRLGCDLTWDPEEQYIRVEIK